MSKPESDRGASNQSSEEPLIDWIKLTAEASRLRRENPDNWAQKVLRLVNDAVDSGDVDPAHLTPEPRDKPTVL